MIFVESIYSPVIERNITFWVLNIHGNNFHHERISNNQIQMFCIITFPIKYLFKLNDDSAYNQNVENINPKKSIYLQFRN